MAKDTYEISIWRDVLVNGHYEEAKIAVIGSDKLKASCRAIEPKLIENINGTNTFTFKMLYQCRDLEIQDLYTTLSVPLPALSTEQLLEESRNLLLVYHSLESIAAEGYANPFIPYLSNERKVKLLWKNQWYDLVIKNCQEDSSGRSIIYTCTDAYINELSKTGFDLVFDTEKQNNQGTVIELGERILEGSDWEIDAAASDTIQQENEEPVFEITLNDEIDVHDDTIDEDTSIYIGEKVLLYYQPIADLVASGQTNGSSKFQFAYATDYTVDDGTQLVNNTHCYTTSNSYSWSYNASSHRFTINGLYFDFNTDLSGRYRAKRLARQQKVVFDSVSKKQCKVYSKLVDGVNHNIYGYTDTVVNNSVMVGNILANASNFLDTGNWETATTKLALYPPLSDSLVDYKAKSLLYAPLTNGNFLAYNSGLVSCMNFISDGLQTGTKFVFRYKARQNQSGATDQPADVYITNGSLITIDIRNYEFDAFGRKVPTVDSPQFIEVGSPVEEDGDSSDPESLHWFHRIITVKTSATKTDLLTTNIGLFIKASATVWFENLQFFKYVEKNNPTSQELAFILPGELQTTTLVETRYNYYDHSIYGAGTALEDIKFIYQGNSSALPTGLSVVYNTGFTKIRSITGKQSNRFNLLQSIGEQFDCWVRFKINHTATGHLIYNADGTPQKYVYFKKNLGTYKNIGFVYGIDLKTIQRTIQSDNIVTKTIVNPNNNEFAKNGFCTIARAGSNFAKNTTIYNFDYYINQGLLDGEVITKDLYQKGAGAIGYYSYLHDYYTEYDANEPKIANLERTKNDLLTNQTLTEAAISSANNLISSYEQDLCQAAGLNNIDSLEDALDYISAHQDNEDIRNLITAWAVTKQELDYNLKMYESGQEGLDTTESQLATLYARQATLLDNIKLTELAFYKKYSRFIQEGTWQSEDYIDDELYYLDAVSLAYRSSRPKVSYNISVVRLSSLDEFRNKIFHLGDITYVQDKEFFGTTSINGIPTPVREQVIISEMTSNLDEPDKDSFVVQNYKSAFDDLFQRVTAATQSLQFSEGAYARAANAITGDGSIKPEVLQAAFNSNKELAMSATNDAVVQDANGITLSSLNDPSRKVRVNSNGIFISKDGGNTWKNAIKSNGVATEALTAGSINANEISIFQGNAPTFRWDFNGLSAYSLNNDNTTINTQTFVRYDRYGIYGIKDITDKNWTPSTENDIWNTAHFGLTWKGFFLKNKTTAGRVEISTEHDIQVIQNDVPRIQLGNLNPYSSGYTPQYGLRINDELGLPVLEAKGDGTLWLEQMLCIGDGSSALTYIGYGSQKRPSTDMHEVINANDNFIVYEDGYVSIHGGIQWTAGASPVQILYGAEAYNTPTAGLPWSSFPQDDATGWHRNKNENDVYGAYTYDGGQSWTAAIRIEGKDGHSINIKGTVATISQLPTSGVVVGDGYLVDTDPEGILGVLYICSAISPQVTWTRAGQIRGPQGASATQYYLHYVYVNDISTGSGYSISQTRKYIGTYVDTNAADAATWAIAQSKSGIVWSQITGTNGIDGQNGADGKSVEAQTLYKYRLSYDDLIDAPTTIITNTGIAVDVWTLTPIAATSTRPFVYQCKQFITTDPVGSTQTGSWTVPELVSAYTTSGNSTQYATFLRLTNGGTSEGLAYNNGELYVNASFINAGTLLVGNANNPLLNVNVTNNTVLIAGFNVSNNSSIGSFYNGVNSLSAIASRGVYVGTDGILVSSGDTGTARASYVKLEASTGKITANAGKIAGFSIDNNSFFTGDAFNPSNVPDIFLCTGTTNSYTIAGHTTSGWGLKVGSNFGVVKGTGGVYCDSLHATGGDIGGWKITTDVFQSILGNYKLYLASQANYSASATSPIGQIAGKRLDNLVMRLGDSGLEPTPSSYQATFGLTQNGEIYASGINMASGQLGRLNDHGFAFDSKLGIINTDTVIDTFESVAWFTTRNDMRFLESIEPLSDQLKAAWQSSNIYGVSEFVWNSSAWNTVFAVGTFNNSATGIYKLDAKAKRKLLCLIPFYCNGWNNYVKRLWQYEKQYYTYNGLTYQANLGDTGTGITAGLSIDYQGNISMYDNGIFFRSGVITDHNAISFNQQTHSDNNNTIYSMGTAGWRKTDHGSTSSYLSWNTIWNNISNTSSDMNLKHSIEALNDLDKYDKLFDRLLPCRYKYNNGTSDRFHTGFIAQEVVEAVNASGLTTQDFAAVFYSTEKEYDPSYDGNKKHLREVNRWFLRRDEFVALNTWQIQKLKSRVASLEARIAELEARL